ncbi:MAG TPA: hypothetical protein VGE40_09475 [Bacilli bacterium]
MNNSSSIVVFIIVAFAGAIILIMKRDTLPVKLKRPMAIFALVMVCLAFILLLYSFFTM